MRIHAGTKGIKIKLGALAPTAYPSSTKCPRDAIATHALQGSMWVIEGPHYTRPHRITTQELGGQAATTPSNPLANPLPPPRHPDLGGNLKIKRNEGVAKPPPGLDGPGCADLI